MRMGTGPQASEYLSGEVSAHMHTKILPHMISTSPYASSEQWICGFACLCQLIRRPAACLHELRVSGHSLARYWTATLQPCLHAHHLFYVTVAVNITDIFTYYYFRWSATRFWGGFCGSVAADCVWSALSRGNWVCHCVHCVRLGVQEETVSGCGQPYQWVLVHWTTYIAFLYSPTLAPSAAAVFSSAVDFPWGVCDYSKKSGIMIYFLWCFNQLID